MKTTPEYFPVLFMVVNFLMPVNGRPLGSIKNACSSIVMANEPTTGTPTARRINKISYTYKTLGGFLWSLPAKPGSMMTQGIHRGCSRLRELR
jgi:hypothetical protein